MIHEAKIKLRGHLKSYLQVTLILGILLAAVNAGIYFINIKSGLCVTGFLILYLIVTSVLLYRNKTLVMNEFINFATQYGQIQKKLLEDYEAAPCVNG